jgi:uncharacterized protein YcfL
MKEKILLKITLVLLVTIIALLGAGCSSNKDQSEADQAKVWQTKQPVPQGYLQQARAMRNGPPPVAHAVPTGQPGTPGAP